MRVTDNKGEAEGEPDAAVARPNSQADQRVLDRLSAMSARRRRDSISRMVTHGIAFLAGAISAAIIFLFCQNFSLT